MPDRRYSHAINDYVETPSDHDVSCARGQAETITEVCRKIGALMADLCPKAKDCETLSDFIGDAVWDDDRFRHLMDDDTRVAAMLESPHRIACAALRDGYLAEVDRREAARPAPVNGEG